MLFLLGDSHTGPLILACRTDPALAASVASRFGSMKAGVIASGWRFFEPFHQAEGDAVRLVDEQMIEAFPRHTGAAEPVIRAGDPNVYVFSFGFHGAPLLRDPLWNDYTLDREDRKRHQLSWAAYDEMVRHQNRHTLAFAAALRALSVRFCFVSAPPLPNQFHGKYGGMYSNAALNAMQARYRSVMAAEFERRGATYFLPPAEVAKDGFLRDDLSKEGDVHHGNIEFGRLTWRRFLPVLDAVAAAP